MTQPEVALFVSKQELEDIQMALVALHNKWIINADLSESQEYVEAVGNSIEELKKLQYKVKIVLMGGF